MRIATAAYPITWLNSWDEYEQKLDNWVADAADHGAEFLVFLNMHRWSFHRLQERTVPQKWKPRCHRFQMYSIGFARHMRNLQNDMASTFYQAARLCGTMAVM